MKALRASSWREAPNADLERSKISYLSDERCENTPQRPEERTLRKCRSRNLGMVELFTELDIMLNEDLGYFEPRPWHEEFPQKPKVWKADMHATNHWGTMPSPEFMFMD